MKKILLVLTAMLLVLAACQQDTGFDRTTPFIGGTQGLKAEFVDSFPPARVSDGGDDAFDVIVSIANRGETFVAAGDVRVQLSGFPASQFGMSVDELRAVSDDLIEANEKNPDGSIISSFPIEVSFTDLAYQQSVQGSQPFPFRADICYKYETRVSSTLCVKNDFRRDQTGDICMVASTRQVFNSGAPIQVTRMSQSSAGSDATRISFTIENRDTGRAFQQDLDCSDQARIENRILVRVEGFDGAGEEIQCRGLREPTGKNEGFVILDQQGKVDISCDVGFSERSPRIQPFNIVLEYDYNEQIQKNVVVERS